MRLQPSRAHATSLRVTPEVMNQIHRMIGLRGPELGGALGGDRRTGCVTHFHFDATARATGATYSPDHKALNRLFSDEWNPAGVNLMGFVHSHPFGFRRPSQGDLEYARRILEAIPEMDRCLLPIVVSQSGYFEFLPFAAVRRGSDVEIDPIELELIDAETQQEVETRDLAPFEGPQRPAVEAAFARVEHAYDLERLEKSRVICVGCGGAASFVEDLARAGVGEFILIDADTVSRENVATQQTYLRDVGRPKVECVAERIGEVNPRAAVVQLQRHLNDDLSDTEFESILQSALRIKAPEAERTLLCGFTDDFGAQARVNRLALQFGVPSLCAQVYENGRGAEVTFTHPEVTPACHRCVLNRRYRAYLEENYQNTVGSAGTPIFATTRLNALKGFVALALLHHGGKHPRWGHLLARIGNRNLAQIRMDPDFKIPAFEKALRKADRKRILFDDVVWLPQQQDCPKTGFRSCPDCGGTGDLRNAAGSFEDTRDQTR